MESGRDAPILTFTCHLCPALRSQSNFEDHLGDFSRRMLTAGAPFGRRGASASPRCFNGHLCFATRPSLAADGATLTRLLQRAGLSKESVIRVTGPAGMTAIMWLYRHGYERAAYVHANWVATMQTADALLVPHTCEAPELRDLLQSGSGLREGGVLIVQTSAEASVPGLDSVPAILEPLGYRVEYRLDERGRDVCVARRVGSDGFKKAA